jgi:hypothetical protein
MFGTLLFTLVGLSLAGFMVNRLYVGIRERQLDVKGIIYSRSATPIRYWITMSLAAYGLFCGLIIGGAGIMRLFQ